MIPISFWTENFPLLVFYFGTILQYITLKFFIYTDSSWYTCNASFSKIMNIVRKRSDWVIQGWDFRKATWSPCWIKYRAYTYAFSIVVLEQELICIRCQIALTKSRIGRFYRIYTYWSLFLLSKVFYL